MLLVLATLALAASPSDPFAESLAESLLSEPQQSLQPKPGDDDYRRFRIEVEGGAVWQSRNDVQIPGDTGTRFSLIDLTGDGPFPVGRITFDAHVTGRHGLRLVLAPLEFSGTGQLSEPTSFAGELFAPNTDTKGSYKFSTYRLTYRYGLVRREKWTCDLGATILVRDAEIELKQGDTQASDDDVGVVPLFHADIAYHFNPRWSFLFDFDGLASPQGRAFDTSLKFGYDFSERWQLAFGYRTLEGGADNDDVFNFAWLHFAVVSLAFRF